MPTGPTAYALLSGQRTLALGHVREDREVLELVRHRLPCLVVVDAPLGLPLGLCCLEEDCSCAQQLPGKGRRAERELARRGIGLYFTTKRSIIKAMVYRAIRLKGTMEALGAEVIEVYPYGTKVILFGKLVPHKDSPEGLEFLRHRLSQLLPSLDSREGPLTHDLYDALLAAYTGLLHRRGQSETVGIPEEGVIFLPRAIAPLPAF